jgi:DNA-binding transcriptional ArsR family regulator
MSKPAVSQHLAVLENAGLVATERGQFVFYRLVPDNLLNTLYTYAQEVCPVSRPLKAESAKLATKNARDAERPAVGAPLRRGGRVDESLEVTET